MECGFCRGEVPEGAKVCPTCGAPVEPETAENQSTNEGQENIYQYGAPSEGQQNTYQYGTPGEGQQGQYQYGVPNQGNYGQVEKPVSGTPYMVLAIITTLLCCLPLGIVAIVYASKIGALQKAGDYAGARNAAKKARIFAIIGIIAGLIVEIFGVAFLLMDSEDSAKPRVSSSIVSEQNDEDDADDKKTEAKPAEASSELGATWDTYTIQINDTVLTLPCTLEDVEAAGLTLDTEYTPESYVVNAEEYILAYFEDENDNEIMVDVVNVTDEAKTLRECLVGGISVDEYDLENDGLTVIFPGGIQIGTSKDDLLAKYGEADDVYEGDSLDMYTWYAEESYYSMCEIDLDVETGVVSSMNLQNYGE